MADTLSESARSERMSRIRAKGTKPEMAVRRLIHSLGYRYRLHRRDLPGVPDLVFPARRANVFVHSCFWHGHDHCRSARVPKSRLSYWLPKLQGNQARDRRNARDLARRGWRVLVLWECELIHQKTITRRIIKFLGPAHT